MKRRKAAKQAAERKAKTAEARAARAALVTHHWPTMSPEEGRAYIEQLAEAKQRARDEYMANPPVQQFSRATWERTANSLASSFCPSRGFLTKQTRDAVYEVILRCSHIHADTIVKLARDFTSNRPSQRWCRLFDFKEEEDTNRGAELHVFRKGRLAFVKEFGPEFARYLIQERKEIKQQRERALLYCLLLVAAH